MLNFIFFWIIQEHLKKIFYWFEQKSNAMDGKRNWLI